MGVNLGHWPNIDPKSAEFKEFVEKRARMAQIWIPNYTVSYDPVTGAIEATPKETS